MRVPYKQQLRAVVVADTKELSGYIQGKGDKGGNISTSKDNRTGPSSLSHARMHPSIFSVSSFYFMSLRDFFTCYAKISRKKQTAEFSIVTRANFYCTELCTIDPFFLHFSVLFFFPRIDERLQSRFVPFTATHTRFFFSSCIFIIFMLKRNTMKFNVLLFSTIASGFFLLFFLLRSDPCCVWCFGRDKERWPPISNFFVLFFILFFFFCIFISTSSDDTRRLEHSVSPL